MIEKMKNVCVVSSQSAKADMLREIRSLGVMHIKQKKAADPALTEKFAELSGIRLMLNEYPEASFSRPVLSDEAFSELHTGVLKAVEEKKSLHSALEKNRMQADRIKDWGDFDPDYVRFLAEKGTELHFYRLGKKEAAQLVSNESVSYIRLAPVDRMEAFAVAGAPLGESYAASEFELPEKGLSRLHEEAGEYRERLDACENVLKAAAQELASYDRQLIKCRNEVNYSAASRTSVSQDGLVWLEGYIPEDDTDRFLEAASANGWAYLVDEPDASDEAVPTKVKYTKITRLMQPVFSILGTVPGYREYDISFWFLCFFSLFFAMIIGDAGYGLCFLAVALVLHIKLIKEGKKANNLVLLIYVVSFATIMWGCVTGTWFGLEEAMNIGFLRALVIKPLANYPEKFGYTAVSQQNSMMHLCFIIGTVQLSLACIMNIRRKLGEKDLSFMADIGWLLSINALYYVVLLLVIGTEVNIGVCAVFILAGFLLVCLFGGMAPGKSFKDGLKAGLADTFTNFLNTISAFGNIMSYIRLFAVGLASLAIAQSFNDMALGMNGLGRVFGLLIFALGHALNLVMGLLSVVVHGVRLNLLEFSGQLNMEWSGTAYDPFRVSTDNNQ